jgi:hypothetical protein
MAKEPSAVAEEGSGKSFFKELSSAAAKKALTPLLATAATAGTTYLIRKSTEIWQGDVLPKVREKGGGKALAKEALEKISGRLSGRYAQMVDELAQRLGDGTELGSSVDQGPTEKSGATEAEDGGATADERREERKQRQQRRQQRQRALQKSAST